VSCRQALGRVGAGYAEPVHGVHLESRPSLGRAHTLPSSI